MKKFMVTVNGKFIVEVESTTNGGAEHVILDNIYNAKQAQAFDVEAGETRGDMFQNALVTHKVISYEELKARADAMVAKMKTQLNEMAEERDAWKEKIRALKEELMYAEVNLDNLEENIRYAEDNSGFKCRYYNKEELMGA